MRAAPRCTAYLLCNLVFSGDHDRDFKVNDVIRWLAEYDVVMSPSEIRKELAVYVEQGYLYASVDHYSVTSDAVPTETLQLRIA